MVIENKLKIYTQVGMKTTVLNLGDNFEVHYPTDQYESYSAFTQDGTAAQNYTKFYKGKLEVRMAAKDKTIYYNRLPYNQFDHVFNPDYLEPPIQIQYKLQMRYLIENEMYVQRMKKQSEEDRSINTEVTTRTNIQRLKEYEIQLQVEQLKQTNQAQIQIMMGQGVKKQ